MNTTGQLAATQTQSGLTQGLSSTFAFDRLRREGPNAVPDTSESRARAVWTKFWAPVPWLLEAAVILQFILHKYLEASVIAVLLVFNALLSYFQEGHAQATLAALKSRLALNSYVLRDGEWMTSPTSNLVREDVVKLSLGAIVPADVKLLDGNVSLDQSMLTGESLPVDATAGDETFAGALVIRGEATAVVTAIGVHTRFGKTAELVRIARAVSSQQSAVLQIVRNLALFNAAVIAAMGVYALRHAMPGGEILGLLLTAILAAIPVALPATFTMAAAIGAESLAKVGVLPTRLSAIDEAATIGILCSDKTGTLTRNQLAVSQILTAEGMNDAAVLIWAAMASSEAGSDPVDRAVRSSAAAYLNLSGNPVRTSFLPFDPSTKVARAVVKEVSGAEVSVILGAFAVVANLATASSQICSSAADAEQSGLRVLGVAMGQPNALNVIGAIALSDPPREDSGELISQLRDLGVRTVMATGDAAATAGFIAHEVGLEGPICTSEVLPELIHPSDYAVFAGIPPEGKYNLVRAFQRDGHTVGMCGDGANDAPALRQAQMGIAVSTATDIAKAAAGIVLTQPGLTGVVAAVNEGRTAFQRIMTYTLNSTVKKIAEVLLLAIGLLMTGHAILTPMLMVLLMVTGDFLSMSLTTDRVTPSSVPNQWRIGRITLAGISLGALFLGFCSALLAAAHFYYKTDIGELRTVSVVAIVFGSQAVLYAIRDRQSRWGPRPTFWLMASSTVDVGLISFLALTGTAMSQVSPLLLGFEFMGAAGFWLLVTLVKGPLFQTLGLT